MEFIFKKIKLIGNNRGQSTVEYIMLLVLVTSIAYTFLQSPQIQKYFGKDSSFMQNQINNIQYSYRHAGEYKEDHDDLNKHDSFYNSEASSSRFFGQTDSYGQ